MKTGDIVTAKLGAHQYIFLEEVWKLGEYKWKVAYFTSSGCPLYEVIPRVCFKEYKGD